MKVYEAVANAFVKEGASTVDEVVSGVGEIPAAEGPMVLDVRILRNVVAITGRCLHYGEDA